MNRKAKGLNAERELVGLFWSVGWAAIRVAGSGSSRYPSPDVIAGTPNRKLAIECKTTKESRKYLSEGDVEQILTFSRVFNAEPWIGVRFDKKEWFFLSIEDLTKTKKGYVIDDILTRRKGLLFEELIGFGK